jgi:hypothetical protein
MAATRGVRSKRAERTSVATTTKQRPTGRIDADGMHPTFRYGLGSTMPRFARGARIHRAFSPNQISSVLQTSMLCVGVIVSQAQAAQAGGHCLGDEATHAAGRLLAQKTPANPK